MNQGPVEDAEEESELSITEMKEKRQREKLEAELIAKAKGEQEEKKQAQDGCSWGIGQCIPAAYILEILHTQFIRYLVFCRRS